LSSSDVGSFSSSPSSRFALSPPSSSSSLVFAATAVERTSRNGPIVSERTSVATPAVFEVLMKRAYFRYS
jgi:hypothetical protein